MSYVALFSSYAVDALVGNGVLSNKIANFAFLRKNFFSFCGCSLNFLEPLHQETHLADFCSTFFASVFSQTVYEESEVNGLHAEETDTDDDIGSFHDDRADSSDDDERGQAKSHDLEWDSTTATY